MWRVVCVIGASAGIAGIAGADVLLYDVDFNAPVHQAGQLVSVGVGAAPRRTVSDRAFGTAAPRIADSFGSLGGQSLRFFPPPVPPGAAGQTVTFAVTGTRGFAESYAAYRVEFDLDILSIADPLSTFTLFADTPTIRPIHWHPAGVITGPNDEFAGTWAPGQVAHILTVWDLGRSEVFLSVGGLNRGTFPISTSSIVAFRFALGGAVTSIVPGEAGVDNVCIWGIPSPGCAGVLVMLFGWGRSRLAHHPILSGVAGDALDDIQRFAGGKP